MFPPVHHQNRPNKKPHFSLFPCDFTSPVHLTFYCHPLFLSGSMSTFILRMRIPAYPSTERTGLLEKCVCQCLKVWSLQGLFQPSFLIQALGSTCSMLIPSPPSLRLPGDGLGCLRMLFSTAVLVFSAWIWGTAQQCLLVTSPPGWRQQC